MPDTSTVTPQPTNPVTPTLDLGGLFDLVPGIKTSELWVVVASAIAGVLAKLGLLCSGTTCTQGQFSDQDFMVLLGAALFYAFGRWVLKNKSLTLSAAIQQILNTPK